MFIRILTIIFAIVGVVATVAIAFYFSIAESIFGGIDPPSLDEIVVSPDGKHEAIRVTSSGGGAAGWCREYVSIINAGESESEVIPAYPDAKKDMVFSIRCDAIKFSVQWKNNDSLTIRYHLSSDDLFDQELKDRDRSGKISVSFEQQP